MNPTCYTTLLLSVMLGACSLLSSENNPDRPVCCALGSETIDATRNALNQQDPSYIHRRDSTVVPIVLTDGAACITIVRFLQVHGDTVFGRVYAAGLSYLPDASRLLVLPSNVIERTDSLDNPTIRLLTAPKFYFITGLSGNRQLVIKHRVSNGNMYFAVVERYYDLDVVRGILHPAFSVESISYMPLCGASGCYIRRVYNQGRVEVFNAKTIDDPGQRIGEYGIGYNKVDRQYYLTHQQADPIDRDVLRTSLPDGPSGFYQ